MQDPNKMLFHVRAKYGCTVLVDDDRIKTLDTKTDQTISALVYPSWHPSGKFVAFPPIIQLRIRIRYIVQKYMTRHRM